MALQAHLEVRPRSLGEILDDAWRLYFSDLPMLLTLSGLFVLPAVSVVLLLLTQPVDAASSPYLWPALAAALLPLTGLGSGACQEACHLWAEDHPPRLGECLAPALRRALNHVAAQALMLILPFCAVVWLVIPGFPPFLREFLAIVFLVPFIPVWMVGLGRHTALAAGQRNLWRAWRHSARASGRYPDRALAVVGCRVALLLLGVLNLHLFIRVALWVAEDLGGFDVALAGLLCSLGNLPYVVVLVGVAWWLLTPFAEAVNYFYFVDARTRYEGLDLWYRVEELFPVSESTPPPLPEGKKYTPTILKSLLAVLALACASEVRADERLDAMRAARKDVQTIRREVKGAEPYPGGQRWEAPLRRVGERLERQGKGGFRWYRQAVDGFAGREQKSAVEQLDRIDERLGLIEESLNRPPEEQGLTPEQIKALVSQRLRPGHLKKKAGEKPPPKEPKEIKPVQQDPNNFGQWRPPPAPALIGGAGAGGVGTVFLWILVGLLVAVLVVGMVVLILQWQRDRKAAPRASLPSGPVAEEEVGDEPVQQDPASLWRRADELARSGDFLGAVRALYLSVLALLHQGGLIRYERTRTNGEYADQLRRAPPLHRPFCRLTGLFEVKWYGERSCREEDYHSCRGLAEELHRHATPAPV